MKRRNSCESRYEQSGILTNSATNEVHKMATETRKETKAEPNGNGKVYNVIGTRPIRHDGADKVTGRAIYTNDLQMAGLAHGKILRSPHAHAKIKCIDTSAAEKLPGVVAVVTAKDLPDLRDKM